jgi:HEAT repeat protein
MKFINLIMVFGVLFLANCQSIETNKYISYLNSSDEMKRLEAILMLQTIKDPKAVDPIINLAMNDVSEIVRVRAVEALGKIGDSSAIPALKDILVNNSVYKNGILDSNFKVDISDKEEFEWVRSSAAETLGLFGDSTVNKLLILVSLFDNSNSVSVSAKNALINLGNKSIVESSWSYYNFKDSIIVGRLFDILKGLHYPLPLDCLKEAFSDDRLYLRLSVVKYCSLFINTQILNDLINILNEPDININIAAIETLGEYREQKAVPPLIEKFNDKNLRIKMAVINALVKINGSQSIDFLFKVIRNNNQTEKELAFDALGRIGDTSVNQKLLGLCESDNWEIRNGAVRALGKYINNDTVSKKITEALHDSNFTVRRSAAEMLLKSGRHEELMTVFDSKNLDIIANLYEFYMNQDIAGKEDLLIQALNTYGSEQMATSFLNSQNYTLSIAASEWADNNGFKIKIR